jgi:phosphoribosylcarboxyaminoimidazole (NCAIR) mutase
VAGRPPKELVDDPLISNPYDSGELVLVAPAAPAWSPDSKLTVHAHVTSSMILPEGITMAQLEEFTRKVFLVLERAWGMQGYRLKDLKIECGVKDGELYLADVVDADSLRMTGPDGREMSKQAFRDKKTLAEVEEIYATVASVSARLGIPKQALVFWLASPDDKTKYDLKFPSAADLPAGVEAVEIVCSGHKSTAKTLRLLEETLAQYPAGGAIIDFVGMSNGLGPITAARTSWHVSSVCLTGGNDIYSNVNLPSDVPMGTFLSWKNALLDAYNVLAMNNPAAYAFRQFRIESLDD